MFKESGDTPTGHPGPWSGMVLVRGLVDPAAGCRGGGHAPRGRAESMLSAHRPLDPRDVEHRLGAPALDAFRHLQADACFWNLFDGEQSRFLRKFVEEHGLAEAELRYVDVGIGDIVRPQKRPKLVGEAAAARDEKRRKNNTERVRAHRERKKAEKLAEGTYRGRGRPRKADGAEARA